MAIKDQHILDLDLAYTTIVHIQTPEPESASYYGVLLGRFNTRLDDKRLVVIVESFTGVIRIHCPDEISEIYKRIS